MSDVDEMIEFFISEIQKKVLDKVAPFKNMKNRSKNKFKLSTETQAEIKKRDDIKKLVKNACRKLNKQFSCSRCEHRFSDLRGLIQHEEIHEHEKPFNCSLCNKEFSDQNGLIEHGKMYQEHDESFSCSIGIHSFPALEDLIEHEEIHEREKPFNCSLCNKEFTDQKGLIEHEKMHHEHDELFRW